MSWQWAASGDWDGSTGTWVDIAGATDAVFSPGAGQVGHYLRASVSYSDGHGADKTAEAISTAAVEDWPCEPGDYLCATLGAASTVVGVGYLADPEGAGTLTDAASGTDVSSFDYRGGSYSVFFIVSNGVSSGTSMRFGVPLGQQWPPLTPLTLMVGDLKLRFDESPQYWDTEALWRIDETQALTAGADYIVRVFDSPPSNDPPAFDEYWPRRKVDENQPPGTAANAAITATDPDGDTITYSLGTGGDHDSFTIDSATGEITTTVMLDHETKATYRIDITATDTHNNTATVNASIKVTDTNDDGTVTLNTDAPTVGRAIRAALHESDGALRSLRWQWSKANTPTGPYTDITGATKATYTPTPDDENHWLRATVTYIDTFGTQTATTTTTNPVAANTTNANGAPGAQSVPGGWPTPLDPAPSEGAP